ncbi:DUF418 domain-containing protein [Thioalkalivibrio sp.]|uniref:DUF418 domain-containing protein n=1 Tax=Thioalkalivibrio sp. TaxID=2093813 RepID=UPI0035641A37
MSASRRIESLDALRGFALLGILLINIQVFSGYVFLGSEGREVLAGSERDGQIQFLLDIAVSAKFYSLFSLLFGYSFVMLAQRMDHPARYHLRRMVGLIAIGAVHALLLWPWDILHVYGAVGLLLIPFLYARASHLALAGLAVLALIIVVRWWLIETGHPVGRSELATTLLQAHTPAFRDGTWGEVIQANVYLTLATAIERLESMRPLRVLALFLLGAAGARLRLAEAGSGHRWILLAGAAVVLPSGLVLAWLHTRIGSEQVDGLYLLVEVLAPVLTAIGYATLLLALWRGSIAVARPLQRVLAPVGRMALTHYLLQSVVCIAIFYGFGLGRYAQEPLAHLVVVAVMIFAAQVVMSLLWLRFFRQGPVEWLWRWQIQRQRPDLLRKEQT